MVCMQLLKPNPESPVGFAEGWSVAADASTTYAPDPLTEDNSYSFLSEFWRANCFFQI
jgi:hypothetical protein